MHGFVLEDREHGFGAVEQRMTWPIEVRAAQSIEDAPIGFRGEGVHFVSAGPAT
jgi:hypothetical protein